MPKNQKWYLAYNGYGFCVTDGWRCDYPIQYDDGRIAYNHPESLPKYIKDKVKRFYKLGCPKAFLKWEV